MNKTVSKTILAPALTAQQVIETVQKRLEPYQPAPDLMEVLPTAVHQEGRWWFVVVPPNQTSKTLSDYTRRMEKAERDLRRMDQLNVGILPVLPDWMDSQK